MYRYAHLKGYILENTMIYMSQPQGKQVTFEQYVVGLRNNVIITYDGAKEMALKAIDDIALKLNEQMQLNQALKTAAEKSPVEPKEKKDKNRNVKKLD